jgi:hypothetical protein
MKSINKLLVNVFLLSLIVLIGIELSVDYDFFDRRMALATTAIIAGVAFLVTNKIVKKKYQFSLPWFVALAVAFSVWLDAIGNFLYYYTRFGWWDDLAHFSGSLSAAVLIYYVFYILRKKGILSLSNFHFSTYVISLVMLFSALYEISEFIGDLLFEMHRVGPRYDTVSDLTYNLMGAALVVLIGNVLTRRKN